MNTLSIDLWTYLLPFLPLSSLPPLALCSHFHSILVSQAFRHHLLYVLQYPFPVKGDQRSWSQLCRIASRIEGNFDKFEGGIELLGREWERICMPIIRLWEGEGEGGRMVVARGAELDVWNIDREGRSWESLQGKGKGYSALEALGARKRRVGRDEMMGLCTLAGTNDVVVGHSSGVIKRLRICPGGEEPIREIARLASSSSSTLSSSGESKGNLQTLTHQDNLLVGATTTRRTLGSLAPDHILVPASHQLKVYDLTSPWSSPSLLPLPNRPWSLLLNSPHLLVGHSGLSLYSLTSTGSLHPSPRTLSTSTSPIYALATPSPSSPSPNSTVLAADYASNLSLYDFRTPGTGAKIIWRDRLNDDPLYSVATGGPGGFYATVGTARNGAIRIFDLRHPNLLSTSSESFSNKESGLTAFTTKHSSPVYSVQMSFSRIFGVTERQTFSIDFDGLHRSELGFGKGLEPVGYYSHAHQMGVLKKTGG